jgi:hypothetical protein
MYAMLYITEGEKMRSELHKSKRLTKNYACEYPYEPKATYIIKCICPHCDKKFTKKMTGYSGKIPAPELCESCK